MAPEQKDKALLWWLPELSDPYRMCIKPGLTDREQTGQGKVRAGNREATRLRLELIWPLLCPRGHVVGGNYFSWQQKILADEILCPLADCSKLIPGECGRRHGDSRAWSPALGSRRLQARTQTAVICLPGSPL